MLLESSALTTNLRNQLFAQLESFCIILQPSQMPSLTFLEITFFWQVKQVCERLIEFTPMIFTSTSTLVKDGKFSTFTNGSVNICPISVEHFSALGVFAYLCWPLLPLTRNLENIYECFPLQPSLLSLPRIQLQVPVFRKTCFTADRWHTCALKLTNWSAVTWFMVAIVIHLSGLEGATLANDTEPAEPTWEYLLITILSWSNFLLMRKIFILAGLLLFSNWVKVVCFSGEKHTTLTTFVAVAVAVAVDNWSTSCDLIPF